MLSISIAIALVLSTFASPGKRLIDLFVGLPAFHTLDAAHRGTVLALIDFWLPAATIYLALRLTPLAGRLAPTPGEQRAITIANAVFILYIVARVFASTIPGGGAGYVVGSLSVFTALPALLVLLIALARVLFRAVRGKATSSVAPRLGTKGALGIALVGFGPVAFAIATLSLGSGSPLQVKHAVDRRMAELCPSAGQQIDQKPEGVDGLFFADDGAIMFCNISDGVYGNEQNGIVAEPLVNLGYLRYVERPTAPPPTQQEAQVASYDRYLVRQPRQTVVDPTAPYGVYRTTVASPEDAALGIEGHVLTVKAMATGQVVATHRVFASRKTGKVCGAVVDSCIDEQRFLVEALGLSRRYETLDPMTK